MARVAVTTSTGAPCQQIRWSCSPGPSVMGSPVAGWIRSGMALASTQHGLEGAPMHSVRPGIRPLTSALGVVAMRWGFFLPYRESL